MFDPAQDPHRSGENLVIYNILNAAGQNQTERLDSLIELERFLQSKRDPECNLRSQTCPTQAVQSNAEPEAVASAVLVSAWNWVHKKSWLYLVAALSFFGGAGHVLNLSNTSEGATDRSSAPLITAGVVKESVVVKNTVMLRKPVLGAYLAPYLEDPRGPEGFTVQNLRVNTKASDGLLETMENSLKQDLTDTRPIYRDLISQENALGLFRLAETSGPGSTAVPEFTGAWLRISEFGGAAAHELFAGLTDVHSSASTVLRRQIKPKIESWR